VLCVCTHSLTERETHTCYEAISAREEPSFECGADVGVDAVLKERAVVFRALLRF